VDSSSAALIERLNERAKMFNPAWILYAIAAAMSVGALATLSTVQDSQDLPDVTSRLSPARRSSARDEYSMLVVRYGEPNSVLLAEPLGIVPVRTAHYSSANTNIVLVPNECVESYEYEVAQRSIAARSTKLAAGKGEMKSTARCTPSLNYGWTIVGYVDSSDSSFISAEMAKVLLDRITVRQTSPPVVEVEKPPGNKQRPNSRSIAKKQPEPNPEIEPNKQALLLEAQMSRNAKGAESWELYSKYALLFGSLGLFVAGIVAHKRNTEKRTSRLFYELDETERQRYSIVQEALTHLGKSNRIWRIEARSATSDWKRNAGASTLVKRVPIGVGRSNPARVETNLAIPRIDIGQVRLFFLPDVILYWERGTFGSIGYDDFRVEQSVTRFIENGPVPADATIVDRTWRYVNKSGGPDRRFNNNVQLPIVQYGVLVLTSSRRLNIHLNTSNAQISLAVANCWCYLNSRSGKRPEPQPAVHSRLDTPSSLGGQAFKMLGLNASASPVEISAAYHHLALMYHPDKVAGLAPEFQTLADKRMKEINAAYELLKRRANQPRTA
jgi:hypothetical protein